MNDYGLASPPYQEKSQSVFLLFPPAISTRRQRHIGR